MTTSSNLSGRIAIVTGASSGIGEHTARALAARGATVALLARRADKLDAIVKDIKGAGGKAFAYAIDVTDSAALMAGAGPPQDALCTRRTVLITRATQRPPTA